MQSEEESNVHWKTRPSSSASPSPGVNGAPDFDRKRYMTAPSTEKDKDLNLSMFRIDGQAVGNQVIDAYIRNIACWMCCFFGLAV